MLVIKSVNLVDTLKKCLVLWELIAQSSTIDKETSYKRLGLKEI